MKIALVRSRVPPGSIALNNMMICDPLELEIVGATLPDKHDVIIFDGIMESRSRFDAMLRSFEPDIVGFTTYINGVNEVSDLINRVKAWRPSTITVVGGVHVTLNGEDLLPTQADVIVQGEGAFTFARLADAYEDAGIEGLKDIEGVRLRQEDGFSPTTTPPYPHPDTIPFAKRELTLRHWPSYYYIYHNPCHLLKTAWGCPYNCSFCYCWRATEGHYAVRSAESVVDELERMWAPHVYIVDDDFFLHPQRLMEMHDLIAKRGIKKNYFAYARSDFVAQNPEIVKAWSKIGLMAVVLGVESYTEKELEYFGKKSGPDVNIEAFQVLRKANVDPYASFILNPGWDMDDFRRMQSYILENRLYYVILQPLMPLPGTAIWDQWEPSVIIDRNHHEMWDISHLALPSRLPMQTYFREMVKLYMRTVYNVFRLPRVKLRTLPSLVSPEALQIPKVVLGSLRVLKQLWWAQDRYRPNELERYEKGRALLLKGDPTGPKSPTLDTCDYERVQKRIEWAESACTVQKRSDS